MKFFTSYIFRSISMFMIGLLLVLNPDTPLFIVQVIAALFAFFGLMSILHYIRAQFSKLDIVRPLFPFTGLGSIGLGVVLGLYPEKFISILMYILGAVIVLIGMNQLSSIFLYRKIAPVRWWSFIMPLCIVGAGILVLAYPLESASLPFVIIGCCCIFNGITELFYGLRLASYQRKLKKESAIQDAEIIEEMQ